MHCLYNAKTEIYDRTLTDMRDRYDPTSAYINCSYEIRNASNQYAYSLYLWCRKKIIQETGQPFDVHKWKDSIRGYWNLSAQGWIDLYEYLAENDEFDLKENRQMKTYSFEVAHGYELWEGYVVAESKEEAEKKILHKEWDCIVDVYDIDEYVDDYKIANIWE